MIESYFLKKSINFGFSIVIPVQPDLSNKPYDAIHKRHIDYQYFLYHTLLQ